jgi:hypothetical protein
MKLPNDARFRRALERRTTERTPGATAPLAAVPLTTETRTFFDEHRVPPALREFLERHCYNVPVTVGQLIFEAVNDLPEENLDEPNAPCIRAGLLVIGDGLNGDPIVVDLESGAVGFVAHDELWGNDDADARALFVPTPFDIGSFYWSAALFDWSEEADFGFPVDSYAARDQQDVGWDEFDPESAGER